MPVSSTVGVVIQGTPFDWLSLVAVVTGGVALILSLFSLFQAHSAAKYDKIARLLEYRYSDSMRLAKVDLRAWYDNPAKRSRIEARRDFDEHRKHFVGYFQKILDLTAGGLLTKREMMALVNRSDLALLLCTCKDIETRLHAKLLLNCDQLPAQCKKRRRKEADLFAFFEEYHRRGYT